MSLIINPYVFQMYDVSGDNFLDFENVINSTSVVFTEDIQRCMKQVFLNFHKETKEPNNES